MLFILVLQAGGLLLIYQVQQHRIQRLMEKVLHDPETVFQKLILSLSDFQRYKISTHEISVKGKMFDIKSISITGNKVEVLAVNDTEEEDIIEDINEAINNGSQQSQVLPGQIFDLLTLLYMSPVTDHSVLLQRKQQSIFRAVCKIIISHTSSIPSPPPRLG